MPSQFESFFSLGREHLRQMHGRPIQYAAGGGALETITAIVGAVESQLYEVPGSREMHHERTVEVELSDVPNPLRADRAVIDGEQWTVEEIVEKGQGRARLRMRRPARVEANGRRQL